MPNPDNVVGKGNRFSANDQPTKDAASKGGKARQRQVRLQKLMKSMIYSSPEVSDAMIAGLQRMGFDTDDPNNLTIAALMNAQVIKAAMGGDLNAIQMAYEMAGEAVDMKSQLEKEKIALEKKKLSMQGKPVSSDLPTIIISADE